ncbi:MAG: DegV family protein [Candidatus Moduliflexus flocculans]|nr:DegV family protein [Candidatus Moduliflexus flocculans]
MRPAPEPSSTTTRSTSCPFNLFFGDSLVPRQGDHRAGPVLRSPPDAARTCPRAPSPSQANVQRALEFLAGHYEAIVAVSVSGGLTGFHDQLLKAREALGLDASRLAVVDSRHLSVSEGLIVLRIAEAVRAGVPFAEIARDAEDWVRKTRIWVDVKTLEIHGPRRAGQPSQGPPRRGPQHQARRHARLRRQGGHPGQVLQPRRQHEEDPRPHPRGDGRPARLELRRHPRPESLPGPALRRSPRGDAGEEGRFHLRHLARRRAPTTASASSGSL